MNNPFYARTFAQSRVRMLSIPLVLPRLLAWLAAGLLSLSLAACGSASCTNANSGSCQAPGQSGSLGSLSLIAGDIGGSGSIDATGMTARLASPTSITADSSGNLYVTDSESSTIRKITPAGVVTTLAGVPGSTGSNDGTGGSAQFFYASGVTADGSGNLYVADTYNHTIRKIVIATGDVTTLAGTAGNPGDSDGTGGAAQFQYPFAITFDGAGNLYVADTFNHTIRKIVIATGVVTTVAGTANNAGSNDGTGGAAEFQYPYGIAADGADLYVADTNNHTIRKIVIATGDVTTLAGTAGIASGNDGTGGAAGFLNPYGITADGSGNLYVADTRNSTIRKIVIATAEVTTLAGTAGVTGSNDGTGGTAQFRNPNGLTVGASGNLHVADTDNHTIREVTLAGVVTSLAGMASSPGSNDGTGDAARFQNPFGLTADGDGNLYVADTFNHTIRKITPAGVVTTLAGMAGNAGSSDGTGGAARFQTPHGITADGAGNLYVADTFNGTIRKITPAGVVTTLAGTAGISGSSDGTGGAAEFQLPTGITFDGASALYVADTNNHTIRKIVIATGDVTTLAGTAGIAGSNNGTGGAARFVNPYGITADGAGNLYVADTLNHTIRKIVIATGEVSTLAGTAGNTGSSDGTGGAARFQYPFGITADGSGNLYVADSANYVIRKVVAATGEVSTVAGVAGRKGILLGDLPGSLDYLYAVTPVDATTLAIIAENAVIRIALP